MYLLLVYLSFSWLDLAIKATYNDFLSRKTSRILWRPCSLWGLWLMLLSLCLNVARSRSVLCQCCLFNTTCDVYKSWKLQHNLLIIAANPSIFEIYLVEAKFGFKCMKTTAYGSRSKHPHRRDTRKWSDDYRTRTRTGTTPQAHLRKLIETPTSTCLLILWIGHWYRGLVNAYRARRLSLQLAYWRSTG